MKIGNLLVNAAYLGDKVLTAIAVGATKVWEGVSKYIKFKDPVAEQLCMKWSSDGIGLTPEDAAKVTDIGTTFQGNTEITSFDELELFGVNSISDYAFAGCLSLTSLTLPINISKIGVASLWRLDKFERLGNFNNNPNITEIDVRAFMDSGIVIQDLCLPNLVNLRLEAFSGCVNLSGKLTLPSYNNDISSQFNGTSISRIENLGSVTTMGNATTATVLSNLPKLEFVRIPFTVTYIGREFLAYCRNLSVVIIEPDVPPQLDIYAFYVNKTYVWLFVPDESVEAYKSATNWSEYADRIKPLSEYQPTNE